MTRRNPARLTRRQERELDLEIEFLSGLTRRDPAYVEALQLLSEACIKRERYTDALRADLQMARLRPDDPRVQYQLARSLVLTNNLEGAYAALNRALDAGYRDFRRLARDPVLAAFRKHPLYRQLQTRLRRLQPNPE